jgi:hypothetical protein
MPYLKRVLALIYVAFAINTGFTQQDNRIENKPSVVILFRTFSFFNFKFNYRLYANDSLVGRIKTHNVYVIETFRNGISLQATTQFFSLNADRRTNHKKYKKIRYPFSLKAGQVYFVQCGFLNENLFDYPRQPTIRLLKPGEVARFLKRGFLKRKLKKHLYRQWILENGITASR